jgi:hypothetical protein
MKSLRTRCQLFLYTIISQFKNKSPRQGTETGTNRSDKERNNDLKTKAPVRGRRLSGYQGYIYPYDFRGEGAYINGYLNKNVLGEYFSEGYRCYCLEPSVLKKKDKELYDYIRGLL